MIKKTKFFKNHNNQRRSASRNYIIEYYAKKYNDIKIKVLIGRDHSDEEKTSSNDYFGSYNYLYKSGV